MSWARLDDGIYDHPKLMAASLPAVALYCLSIAYASRHSTDGMLRREVTTMLARGDRSLADQLVALGLYEVAESGHRIHDFLHYNPSSREVEKRRKQQKLRVRKYRARSDVSNASRNALLRDGSGEASSSGKKGVQGKENRRSRAELLVAFETFWKVYPPRNGRREGRAEAEIEYLKLAPDESLEAKMLEAVRRFARSTDKPLDACRWIKRRRWEDEIDVRPERVAIVPAKRNPELERIEALERELQRGRG